MSVCAYVYRKIMDSLLHFFIIVVAVVVAISINDDNRDFLNAYRYHHIKQWNGISLQAIDVVVDDTKFFWICEEIYYDFVQKMEVEKFNVLQSLNSIVNSWWYLPARKKEIEKKIN